MKSWHYIVIAVVIKAIFFFFFVNLKCPDCLQKGSFYILAGDAHDYVEPVENLVNLGEHKTDKGEYSLRMPGYTPVLLFFRLFLDLNWAINFTLLTQVILSGISCFVLALISLKLFNSKKLFLLTFITYTLSTYVTIWDTYVLTESFATSALIFSFYYILLYKENPRFWPILLSSLFLTWCVFLRPFMIPIIILFLIVLWIDKEQKKDFKKKLFGVLIFILPLFISEASWVLRNYNISNQLILTQSRMTYNDEDESLSNKLKLNWYIGAFSSSFGGDHTFWNPKGATYWFLNNTGEQNKELFPRQIFNDSLTFQELLKVKEKCLAISSDTIHLDLKNTYEIEVKKTLMDFHNAYKTNHPFHYYITSRIIHLKNFILHSGVYNIPFPALNEQNIFQKLFKLFYAVLYLGVFIVGSLYSIYMLKTYLKSPIHITFILTPLFIILLFPFAFKIHEFRFNTLAYPFYLICFNTFLIHMYNAVKQFFKTRRSPRKV